MTPACGCVLEPVASDQGAWAVGVLPQATKAPTISATHPQRRIRFMVWLFLEALGAGCILVGIIWWTMFSGRKNGELPNADEAARENNDEKGL
jgi:cytoskeletal protein RodZ